MKHVLEADGISLSFGTRRLLSDIFVRCQTGQIIGLLGRNGAGKSCLMKAIYGTIVCEKSVRIDGKNLRVPLRYPDLLRYLPQENFLPPDFSIRAVFADFELSFPEFTERFPEFNKREKVKISSLSEGERRLIELYLIIRPPGAFVLLDEPFTHLNPLQIEKVKELILSFGQEKGFIITDHMFNEMDGFCDRFYVLADGKLHNATTTEEIAALGYLKL